MVMQLCTPDFFFQRKITILARKAARNLNFSSLFLSFIERTDWHQPYILFRNLQLLCEKYLLLMFDILIFISMINTTYGSLKARKAPINTCILAQGGQLYKIIENASFFQKNLKPFQKTFNMSYIPMPAQ